MLKRQRTRRRRGRSWTFPYSPIPSWLKSTGRRGLRLRANIASRQTTPRRTARSRRRLRWSTASQKRKGLSSASNSIASCSILGKTVAPTGPVASSCIVAANAAWRGTRQARASPRRQHERSRRARPSGVSFFFFRSVRSRLLWGVV